MRHLFLGFSLMLATAVLAGAQVAPLPKPGTGQAIASFAGECFWRTDVDFGEVSSTSGYTSSTVANPHYEQVWADDTGNTEPKGEG